MSAQTSLLKASLNSCRDGILIFDSRKDRVADYNQLFLDMWNVSEAKAKSCSYKDLLKIVQAQLQDPDQYASLQARIDGYPSLESFAHLLLKSRIIIEVVSKALIIDGMTAGRVWSFRDVTTEVSKRNIALARAEIMTSMVKGATLDEILKSIVLGVERINEDMLCSILLVDRGQTTLRIGAAPTLPVFYSRAVDGMLIGPTAGSCGAAVFRKERVIVTNLFEDPLWAPYRVLAESASLSACWSEPILDSKQNALGTFAIYCRDCRLPSAGDILTITEAARLAAIAIEKKRSEDITRSLEQRFRSVFENSKDAIVLTTAAGILDCNRRAWEMFELPGKAEFLSCNLFSMSPSRQPNEIESAAAAQYHLMQGYQEGRHEYEWVHCTRKGREFPTEVTLNSFPYDSQRVLQFTIRDISERKRSEQALISQREKLVVASKMSSLGEMAGGVAHEINNPLAIIIGQTSLLRRYHERDHLDPERLTEGLFKIESTAQRIAKIVNGLRSFSRNSEHEPMEQILVRDIIEQTLNLCQAKFRYHTIKLMVDVDCDVSVECRASQIAQLIMNLLNNAYDAVEGLSGKERWVKLEVFSIQNCVNFVVCDSGPGINPAIREKIMQPFFTTKEVGKGTGLGLSISRGISDGHGGTLRYDTHALHSTFVFTLPISQQGCSNQQSVMGLSRHEQLPN